MAGYLVAFVTDTVDDALSGAVRSAVRDLANSRGWEGDPPGFFDDPGAADGAERTMGVYLRPGAEPGDVQAVGALVRRLSAERGVGFEVQLAERVVGRVRAGEADAELAASLPAFASG